MAAFFSSVRDKYGGITLDVNKQANSDLHNFKTSLSEAVIGWKHEGVRGVWLVIPPDNAELVPSCIELGFTFHHVEDGVLTLTQFLPEDEKNNLPDFATQYLGCGGMVINSHNEVLAIQEKYSVKPHWKLPGGMADKGEEIGEAAVREVREETGIEAEFVAILGIRHQHQFRFGCSDLYAVCLLRPLDEQQPIKVCPQEIARAQWMPLEEYMEHPSITEANRYFAERYLQLKSSGFALQPSLIRSFDKKRYNTIYSVQPFPQEINAMQELQAATAAAEIKEPLQKKSSSDT